MKFLSTILLSCSLFSAGFVMAERSHCGCTDCKCTEESNCGCLSGQGCTCKAGCPCSANGVNCVNPMKPAGSTMSTEAPVEHENS